MSTTAGELHPMRSQHEPDQAGQVEYRVTRISSLDQWRARCDEWKDLVEDAAYPNVFTTWEWQSTWWEHFGEGKQLYLLVVENEHRLVGALPLYASVVLRAGSPRTLRLVGYGECVYPEYLGIIVRQGCVEPTCQALAVYLQDSELKWQELLLEDIACEDEGTQRFVELMGAATKVVRRPEPARFYCPLGKSYDELLAQLSGHSRQKKRNRLRQAIKKYQAQLVECTCENEEQATGIVQQLTEISCAGKGEQSSFTNPRYRQFQADLLSSLLPAGHASVLLMLYDGVPAAFWYVFVWNGRYYGYQTACDKRLPGSPGDVCLQLVINRAIEEEMMEMDFLRGEHKYKESYATKTRECATVWLWKRASARSTICRLRETIIRPLFKKLQRLVRGNASTG